MIDLHCHILPGMDDGSPDLETSVELARRSVADGISLVVATPHVNGRFMPRAAEILDASRRVNDALAAEGVPLVVSPGAEIAATEVERLDDEELSRLALGGSSTVLIESPYVDTGQFLSRVLFAVQSRGFRVLLAHPERSPAFQGKPEELRALVDRGMLTSVTAGALRGRFGRRVTRWALDFIALGLVHNISSDAHDLSRRPPGLSAGFEGAAEIMPALAVGSSWFTDEVPQAILTNGDIPFAPFEFGGVQSLPKLGRLFG